MVQIVNDATAEVAAEHGLDLRKGDAILINGTLKGKFLRWHKSKAEVKWKENGKTYEGSISELNRIKRI